MQDSVCDSLQRAMELYRKFLDTKQEPLRLAVALEGFFMEEGVREEEREAYGVYLRKRIRPAVEALMEEEAVEKLEYLESLGWFDAKQVDGFIETAKRKGRTASLVWFLHLKNEKYGYADKDFVL